MSDRVNDDLTDQQLDAVIGYASCFVGSERPDHATLAALVAEVRRRRNETNATVMELIRERERWERFPSDEAIEAADAAVWEKFTAEDGGVGMRINVRAALEAAKKATT
jgi:hypothetical protein